MHHHFCKCLVLILSLLSFPQYGFCYQDIQIQKRNFEDFIRDFDSDGDLDSTGLETDSMTKAPTPTPTPSHLNDGGSNYILLMFILPAIPILCGLLILGGSLYSTRNPAPQAPQSHVDPFANSDNCVVVNNLDLESN